MHEVKRREEEHEFLKNIEKRVRGLEETGWKLARRERRLIAQGLLKLVEFDPEAELSNTVRRPSTPGASKEWDVASTSSSDWMGSESSAFASATHFTAHPSPRRRAQSLSHLRDKHGQGHGKEDTSVYAFVFTDVVLLTIPSGGSSPEELELLHGIGVSKVLTALDLSGQTSTAFSSRS